MSDYLPIIISVCSLLVSVAGVYYAHFRSASVTASLGPKLHMYHPADKGTAFMLDVMFINSSRVDALIDQMFLEVIQPNYERYYLAWQRLVKHTPGEGYAKIADAAPFFVGAQSMFRETYWFWWSDIESRPLDFMPGKIRTRVYYWISGEQRPRISDEKAVVLGLQISMELQKRHAERDPLTQIFSFEEKKLLGVYQEKESSQWWKSVKPLS